MSQLFKSKEELQAFADGGGQLYVRMIEEQDIAEAEYHGIEVDAGGLAKVKLVALGVPRLVASAKRIGEAEYIDDAVKSVEVVYESKPEVAAFVNFDGSTFDGNKFELVTLTN